MSMPRPSWLWGISSFLMTVMEWFPCMVLVPNFLLLGKSLIVSLLMAILPILRFRASGYFIIIIFNHSLFLLFLLCWCLVVGNIGCIFAGHIKCAIIWTHQFRPCDQHKLSHCFSPYFPGWPEVLHSSHHHWWWGNHLSYIISGISFPGIHLCVIRSLIWMRLLLA